MEYLNRGQLDYALASIDGLAEHIESISVRGREAEGAEEFTDGQLQHIESALRDASLGILTHQVEDARVSLSGALDLLGSAAQSS